MPAERTSPLFGRYHDVTQFGAMDEHLLVVLHEAPTGGVVSGTHRRVKGMHRECRRLAVRPGAQRG